MGTPVATAAERKKPHWIPLLFIPAYHIALLITLPLYLMSNVPSATLLVLSFVLLTATLMSITCGYHRLYSHVTYKTKTLPELFFLFFGTVAGQGSAMKWSHDHRLHHRHVDTDKDPYGTPKGFWHSHMLWLFWEPPEWQERIVKDLAANKLVAFQHKYYGILFLLSNALIVLVAGLALGDLFGALVFLFLLRLFLGHHCTWFINSIAHIWGSKPYSTEHSAVNNAIIALLTFGEGYHNYHHTFAGDYRNGVRWYQFDPSKWTIWILSKLGLATGLRRINSLTIKKRLVVADRRLMLEHLEGLVHIDTEHFVEKIEQTSHKLSERIADLKTATERYRQLKGKAAEKELRSLKLRIAAYRRGLHRDMETWKQLCNTVLKLEPAV
ncbi:MAG: fatty acid desaturase [Candidatus Latescibacterota bacterium]|jgi:stearoyl-CoA desaturase (delta-9 desaturase)